MRALETFLQVRHRGHLWTTQASGQPMDAPIAGRPLYPAAPEALLPGWALAFYRELQQELQAEAYAPQQ